MARIKEKLGGQVMIVSGSDDRSMQLRQKMYDNAAQVTSYLIGFNALYSLS